MLAQELHSLSALHSNMNRISKISVDAAGWPWNVKRMPRTGFPEEFTAKIQWDDDRKTSQDVSFVYYKSGCNRDTFIAKNHPWLLKGMCLVKRKKKKPNKHVENQCLSEWVAYQEAEKLHEFLPEVYHYEEMHPEADTVAWLLMERLAFSWDELVEQLEVQTPCLQLYMMAVRAQCRIVEFYYEAAQKEVPLFDAHGGNLCFVDKTFTTVRLVDWCFNDRIPTETPQRVMAAAIEYFTRFSPGLHKHGKEGAAAARAKLDSLPENIQGNVLNWRVFLEALSKETMSWFERAHDPQPQDLVQHVEDLSQVAKRASSALQGADITTVSFQLPPGSEVIPDSEAEHEPTPTQKASLFDPTPSGSMAHMYVHAGDAFSMTSQTAGTPGSSSSHAGAAMNLEPPTLLFDRTPSHSLSFMFVHAGDAFSGTAAAAASSGAGPASHVTLTTRPYGWGAGAFQSLLTEGQKQRAWMNRNPIRHGRGTERSVSLETRLATDNFGEHSGDGSMRPVEEGHDQGDIFKLVIRLIQKQLREGNFLERCGGDGWVPRAATDPEKWHGMYYRKFVEKNPHFSRKPAAEQMSIIRAWLFNLWSTDPNKRVMRPTGSAPLVLCSASWGDFWLEDDELDSLVFHVITDFREQYDQLFQ